MWPKTTYSLSPLISFNHKAPRTMKASMLRVSGRLSGQSQSQSNHWQKIIESLDKLLKILQDNHVCVSLFPYHSLVLICWMCVYCCFVYPQVPPVLAQKIFTQIFSYINVQLFNRCAYLSVSWLLCLRKLAWSMVVRFCSAVYCFVVSAAPSATESMSRLV